MPAPVAVIVVVVVASRIRLERPSSRRGLARSESGVEHAVPVYLPHDPDGLTPDPDDLPLNVTGNAERRDRFEARTWFSLRK